MKRRFLAGVLALCMVLGMLPGKARAAEMIGDSGVTWELAGGTLTIAGTGAMPDYTDVADVPWYSDKASITAVEIGQGVTTIGACAFHDCTNLTSITISDGITAIGASAFQYCGALTNITIPGSVKTIGDEAFANCAGLKNVVLKEGVESIGTRAFSSLNGQLGITVPAGSKTQLSSITIPKSVTFIGGLAFAYDPMPGGGCNNAGGGGLESCVKTIFYNGTPDDWDNITQGTANCTQFNGLEYGDHGPFSSDEIPTIYYTPTLTLETQTIGDTQQDPAIVITSDTDFKTLTKDDVFVVGADDNVTDEGNAAIVLDMSSTNLVFSDVSVSSSARAAGDRTLTLSFTGTVGSGVPLITVNSAAYDVLVSNNHAFTAGDIQIIPSARPEDPDPNPDPDPEEPPEEPVDPPAEPDPAPSVPAIPNRPITYPAPFREDPKDEPEGVRVVSVDEEAETGEPDDGIEISGTGESPIQYIVKDEPAVNWIDRVELPRYARDLYTVLCIGGDGDTLYDLLIRDEYQELLARGSGDGKGEEADIESVLTLTADLDLPYSSGEGIFQEDQFASGFDVIDTTAGDKSVDYAALQEGDVVRTSAYNGIFVTSIRKDGNDDFDADKQTAAAYASTAFQAFDRDHPEVFWLSGKSKLRLVTVTMKNGEETYKETYIFFLLADADGFTVRDPRYGSQAEIEADIARRDGAVEAILATVTGNTPNEQAAQLNRWLTEHNEYNTSADLLSLDNWPHECLSALVGSVGTVGPVCDGYSRAFKVLCDKLEIPCVLVDGYARVDAEDDGEFHMWNSARMPDGQWYGVDVTWNDPKVAGVSGAVSGREREDFLLVGADTVVLGLKFSVSHPPVNRAANGGVAFTNGPTLSPVAFAPAEAAPLPFADVAEGSWYYGAVQYVYEAGIMQGTGAGIFAPSESVTRAMTWTILARLAGAETAGGSPWYAPARTWAMESGVSDGSDPDGAVTREQLVTMLWRTAGSPASGGSLEGFTDSDTASGYALDALCWAVETGVIAGIDGALQPQGEASRAQLAAILERTSSQA